MDGRARTVVGFDKTEVVILTKKRIPTILPVRVGDVIVETKPVAKYLSVLIDTKMSFSPDTVYGG